MSVTGAAAYEGALHRKTRRGVNTVTFEAPGGRRGEVPVNLKRFRSAKFRGKDGAKRATDREKFAGFNLCRTGSIEDHRVSAKTTFGQVKAVLAP